VQEQQRSSLAALVIGHPAIKHIDGLLCERLFRHWKLSINQRLANVVIRDSGCDGMDYIALEISSPP
jgi:hypothetical protein